MAKRNRLTDPKTFTTTGRLKAPPVFATTKEGIKTVDVPLGGKPLSEAGRNPHVFQAVTTSTLYLVSCVSMKRVNTHPARDLYISEWFKKARAYVELQRRPWFILSAQYGLLRPTELAKPYEKTLNQMSKLERAYWAKNVWRQLNHQVLRPQEVVFLAGIHYREYLAEYFEQAGVRVTIPMDGLTIGRQLQWLKQATTDQTRQPRSKSFFGNESK